MKIYSFHISILNGKIAFKSESHKEMFNRWIAQFEGQEVQLEISEKKSKRSEQQNKYLWVYYEVISRETGYAPIEVHEWAKSACLPTAIKEIFGDKTRIKKSTTELSKGEMVEFIMNIEAKTGIPAPDTEAYLGFSYHK